jgi:hypothetical protein
MARVRMSICSSEIRTYHSEAIRIVRFMVRIGTYDSMVLTDVVF